MDALGPVGPVHQKGCLRVGLRPATYLDRCVANYLDPVGGSLRFQEGFEVSWASIIVKSESGSLLSMNG